MAAIREVQLECKHCDWTSVRLAVPIETEEQVLELVTMASNYLAHMVIAHFRELQAMRNTVLGMPS